MIPAAPNPCSTRAAISNGSVSASPHARDAAVNPHSPHIYTRRYPMISPSAENGSSETVTAN